MTKKIVIYGPPLAGKTTLLRAYARSRGLAVEEATQAWSGLVSFRVARVRDVRNGLELVTLPGKTWTKDMWWPFLTKMAGLAIVLDSEESRESAGRVHVDALLARTLNVDACCTIWTKRDLLQGEVSSATSTLSSDPRLAPLQRFETRHDKPESLEIPLAWLAGQLAAITPA